MLILSLVLHEAGHIIAGIACGYQIRDAGILLLGIFPVGGYIAYKEDKTVAKKANIQFSLAGIEINFLLAGICLLISLIDPALSLTLVSVAHINIILAVVNLLPAPRLDGESAVSAFFEVDSIYETAKKRLSTRQLRTNLFHSGVAGYALFCVFVSSILSQVLFWLMLVLEVLCVALHLAF